MRQASLRKLAWINCQIFSSSSPISTAPIISAVTAIASSRRRTSTVWRQAGTRFDNFFVATPICMPNRATFMTGRMPSLHGARQNGIPLSLTATTFVDILRSAGYDTALIGKCHLQSISGARPTIGMPQADPDRVQPPEHLREADKSWLSHGRYDQELRSTWQNDPNFELALPYYGFNHVELAVGHGDEVVGHYDRWLKHNEPNADALRGRKNQLPGNNYVAPQAWRTALPEELYPTAYVAERTIRYLENYSRSDRSNRSSCNARFPTRTTRSRRPALLGYVQSGRDPFAAVIQSRRAAHRAASAPALSGTLGQEANRDGQRTFAVTEREVREATALTYGMISMIDDAIGSILGWLKTLRLDNDTVVIFTSDHGDFMGDHQLLLKGALHYRGLVRVPCIWRDPANETAGTLNSGLCGTIDLAPTILDRAGLAGHNGMQGKSLLPALAGASDRS